MKAMKGNWLYRNLPSLPSSPSRGRSQERPNGGEVAIGSRIGATPAGGAFQGVRADWLIQQVDIQFGDDVAVIGIDPVGLMGEAGWCAQSMQLRL